MTCERYTGATLTATLSPQKVPDGRWRECMEAMSISSCAKYRSYVFGHPQFVQYFRAATPVDELGELNIGSRPQRRKKGGGVETLRAIPWIFGWTQTRFHLPVWLGAGSALAEQVCCYH
jgi:phosphoenolpyruvate carboxylase